VSPKGDGISSYIGKEMIFALVFAFLGAIATECDSSQMDQIYNAMQPAGVDFQDPDHAGVCSAWKSSFENTGDNYSSDFFNNFCACGVYVNNEMIQNLDLGCTMNGISPYGLMESCDALLCNDADPDDKCECDPSWTANAIPPESAFSRSAIINFCMGHFETIRDNGAGSFDLPMCSCFQGFPPVDVLGVNLACAFTGGVSPLWKTTMKFHGGWQACTIDAQCRGCFDSSGVSGAFDFDTESCLNSCPAEQGTIGCAETQEDCLDIAKAYLGDDCFSCTALGYSWVDSEGVCTQSCPPGGSCMSDPSQCPTDCPGGCGEGECLGGYCYCGDISSGSMYGANCESARYTVTIDIGDLYEDSIDIVVTMSTSSGTAAGSSVTQEGSSGQMVFPAIEGDVSEIDTFAQGQICYFTDGSKRTKLLQVTGDNSEDITITMECIQATIVDPILLSRLDLTADMFTPYINTDLIYAYISAIGEITGTTLEEIDVNMESWSIQQPTSSSAVALVYILSEPARIATEAAGPDFVTVLEQKLAVQPSLAHLWQTETFSIEFVIDGVSDTFDYSEMTTVLADVGDVEAITVTLNARRVGVEKYVTNVLYSADEASITAIIDDVNSGSYQSSLTTALSSSTSFAEASVQVTNSYTAEFTLELANTLNEDELVASLAATVPYPESDISVSCVLFGAGNYQCATVFTGDMDALSTVEATLTESQFQTDFQNEVYFTSMGGANIVWDESSLSDLNWVYDFSLQGVVAMNTTELIEIVADAAGVSDDDISFSMLQLSNSDWCITVTFTGSQSELVNVLNHIYSGAFSTNMQYMLSYSYSFDGTLLAESCGTSTVSMQFDLCNVISMDSDELSEVVATGLGVPLPSTTVSTTEVTGSNFCHDVVVQLVDIDTALAQVLFLMQQTRSLQSVFDSQFQESTNFVGAQISPTRDDTLAYVFSVVQDTMDSSTMVNVLATLYGFDSSMMSVVSRRTETGYDVQIMFHGASSTLSNVMVDLSTDPTATVSNIQTALRDNGGSDFTNVIVEGGVYPEYIDCVNFYFYFEGACDVQDTLDILFVVDSSGSIDYEEFDTIRSWMELVVDSSLPANTRPAVLQFASIQRTLFDFGTYTLDEDVSAVKDMLQTMNPIGGATFTKEAIQLACSMFANRPDPQEKKLLVFLTDGEPTEDHSPCDIASCLTDQGITVMVIGVGDQVALENVECLATEPNTPYVVYLPSYNQFADVWVDFQSLACPTGTTTDFSGTYIQSTNLKWNDRFVYQSFHEDDDSTLPSLQMFYNGDEWQVESGNGDSVVGSFVSQDGGYAESPAERAIWKHFDAGGVEIARYNAMVASCTTGISDAPTYNPTAETTGRPTTVPHITPSVAPTTELPTSMPSIEECLHLLVYRSGCAPEGTEEKGLVFVVDSSSSITFEAYEELKAWIAYTIRNVTSYGNPYTIGLMQFGSSMRVEFTIDEFDHDYEAMIERVEAMTQLGGATYTRQAVEYALAQGNKMIFEAAQLPGIEVTALLITDGVPTDSWAICTDSYDAGNELDELGVLGLLIAVGEDLDADDPDVGCWPSDPSYVYSADDFSTLDVVAIGAVTEQECPGGSPFDGRYFRTDEIDNGEYTYENNQGFRVYFAANNWVFQDNSGGSIGTMISEYQERTPFPPNLKDWEYRPTNGETEVYTIIRISCTDQPTPTGTPTPPPSERPSGLPSNVPTKQPSNLPSTIPSICPTGQTAAPSSPFPSGVPSVLPTQDCDSYLVYPGVCKDRWGLDFVFAPRLAPDLSDANLELIQEFFVGIVDDIIPDPKGDDVYTAPSSALGTVRFSDVPSIDFNMGEWDTLDDWIEWLTSMQKMPTDGNDIDAAVQTAMTEMFSAIGDGRKDKIMITVLDEDPAINGDNPCPTGRDATLYRRENGATLAEQISGRGILSIVITVGESDNNWQNVKCLATSEEYQYVNVDDYSDLQDVDLSGMLCQEPFHFQSQYQRTEDPTTFVSPEGYLLTLEGTQEPLWKIRDGPNDYDLISRTTDSGVFPPDKATWDFLFNGTASVYHHIRLVCAPYDIPTSRPTSTQPTVGPTPVPITSEPTKSPIVAPTQNPFYSPTGSPDTSEPTNPPTPVSPTKTPSVTPTDPPSGSPTPVSPSTSPSGCPTSDQPTYDPSTTPSKTPSSVPTTSGPSVTPSESPSVDPTMAPTDDCPCFNVGICYCYPDRYSPQTCFHDADVESFPYDWTDSTGRTHSIEGDHYMYTPFNGRYCRTDREYRGKPTYENIDGWIVYWDGETWLFDDPEDVIGNMGEVIGGELPYPDNWRIWAHASSSEEGEVPVFTVYPDVTICCTNTTYPTPTPSYEPSVEPTARPSLDPTKTNPTVDPSSSIPSTKPSKGPSVDPTMSPSADTPTRGPTTSPTTDQPTEFPTSDQPTVSPSSVSPTKQPIVRPTFAPTVPPTIAPTDDCVHFVLGSCPCLDPAQLDVIMLVDGSDSASTSVFQGIQQ